MSRGFGLVLVCGLVLACGEDGLSPRDSGSSLTAASPPSGFAVVQVFPNAKGQGATASNLNDALAQVALGGTIRVNTGTYVTQDLVIDKSVTIVGVGSDLPTIDAAGAFHALLVEDPAVDVTVRGVRVVNAAGFGIELRQFGQAVIEDSEFFPDPNDFGDAGVGSFGGAGGPVLVRNNRFVGGSVGVHLFQRSDVDIVGNRFEGQLDDAFRYVESDGRAEGNAIVGCGALCFTVLSPPNPVSIVGNDVTVDISDPVGSLFEADGGGSGTIELLDNRIVGTGGTRDPNDRSTWPIQEAAFFQLSNFDDVLIERNHVEGAFRGFLLRTDLFSAGQTWTATDNVFQDVGQGIVDEFGGPNPDASILSIRFNDVTTFDTAIQGGPDSFFDGDLTCNWWGSADGPPAGSVSPGIDPAVYVPFATSPIAGTSAAGCSGGA